MLNTPHSFIVRRLLLTLNLAPQRGFNYTHAVDFVCGTSNYTHSPIRFFRRPHMFEFREYRRNKLWGVDRRIQITVFQEEIPMSLQQMQGDVLVSVHFRFDTLISL